MNEVYLWLGGVGGIISCRPSPSTMWISKGLASQKYRTNHTHTKRISRTIRSCSLSRVELSREENSSSALPFLTEKQGRAAVAFKRDYTTSLSLHPCSVFTPSRVRPGVVHAWYICTCCVSIVDFSWRIYIQDDLGAELAVHLKGL